MKSLFLCAVLWAGMSLPAGVGNAAEGQDATAQLQALMAKVHGQLREGKTTEKELAPALKEFDDLLAAHRGEKTDAVAQILYMKAVLYVQFFNKPDEGVALLQQLKQDFPNTRPGKKAGRTIAMVERQREGAKIQSQLVVGQPFPDFTEKDLAGQPVSIAQYKGKVVLIDFWATWCGPCVGELPNVSNTYQKYHAKGFEIIGISLDRDEQKLRAFLKEKGVTWQQFFDGKFWENKLAVKYGINSIPATYLLDGQGKIIGRDLRGDALPAAVGQALAK